MIKHGKVLWLMGPTSSGKTTIGDAVVACLRSHGQGAILFDGDEVRDMIGSGQGFSPTDRMKTVQILVDLANKAATAGLTVIVAALTANPDTRYYITKKVINLRLGYVSCPIAVCAERDPKGLYAMAARGEIDTLIGVNGDYQAPDNPDIVLDTQACELSLLVEQVETYLEEYP